MIAKKYEKEQFFDNGDLSNEKENSPSSEHVRRLAVLHQNQLAVQGLMKRELPAVIGVNVIP